MTIPQIDEEFARRLKSDEAKNAGKDKKIITELQNTVKKIIAAFKSACAYFHIDFDLAIKRFNKFTSGTERFDSSKLYIKYDEKGISFNKIVKTYRLSDEDRAKSEEWEKHIFYIFYKPRTVDVGSVDFIKYLLSAYRSA